MSEQPVSHKYTFVCDPDECDTMFEVTTSDKFGFPSGITKLKCPCGRDTSYVSFIDSISKDMHRDSQPTERSNTMTMIDGTPANEGSTISLTDRLNRVIVMHRDMQRSLFEHLNDYVMENQLSIDNDIPLKELDDILLRVFTHRMTFTREYEVQVEHTLHTTFTIIAGNEDEAVEIANGIGICDEPEFDTPHDSEVTEWVLADTRILYSGEK